VASDTELLHLSLARRDYLRHPVLLAEILALHALMRLTSGPARRALGRAIGELKVAVCDRRARAQLAAAGRAPHRLNIGCGEKLRPGWLNIDLDPRADLRLDIRRPLPFPEGSCAEIYSEHVLAHLAYPGEVEEVLRDWWRVLAPGGTLSVGVPDTVYPLASYVNEVEDYFAWCRTQPWNPPWIETRLDQDQLPLPPAGPRLRPGSPLRLRRGDARGAVDVRRLRGYCTAPVRPGARLARVHAVRRRAETRADRVR